MIRAIIFDCFGVLIEDSLKKLMDDIRQTNPERGQELTDILHASHRGLIGPAEANEQLAAGLGFSVQEFRRWIDEGEIKNKLLLEYITTLRTEYKTALLSNIGIGSLERRFSQEEFQMYFDTVVASGEVGYAKPEPEIYEIAADRLNVRFDECVFTDDREEFCEAARGVGMQAICYQNFTQFRSDLEKLL